MTIGTFSVTFGTFYSGFGILYQEKSGNPGRRKQKQISVLT
jgi:hypothetical protein